MTVGVPGPGGQRHLRRPAGRGSFALTDGDFTGSPTRWTFPAREPRHSRDCGCRPSALPVCAEPVGPHAPACPGLRPGDDRGLLTPRRPVVRPTPFPERHLSRARSSPPRPVRGAGPPRPRRRRRPRAWSPAQIGPVADGTPNWLTSTLADHRRHLRHAAKALVPPLIVTAVDRQHRQPQAGLQRRPAGRPDAALVRHHRADRRRRSASASACSPSPGRNSSVDAATPQPTRAPPARGWTSSPAWCPATSSACRPRRDDDGSIGLSFNVLQLIVIVGRHRHRRAQGRRAGRAVPRPRPLGAGDRAEGAVVGHPARPDRHRRPDRQRGRHATAGTSLGSLGVFAGAVYAGLALVLFVVYPVLLRPHGLSPLRFFAGAWPAIQLAFVSRSSIGTLPVTERVTEQNLGVPRSYASFAVPLGATTKMDGCAAIYPALAAIFVAQFFGVRPVDHRLPADRARLGHRLGGHRRRHRRGVMLTLTLSTLGLPLAGVGLLLAIDPILDMGRTAVNVAGQALVPTIVAKREGILDVERYRVDVHRRPAGAGRGARRRRRRPARSRSTSEQRTRTRRARSSAGGPGPCVVSVGQVRAAGLVGQQRPEDRPTSGCRRRSTHGVAAFADRGGRASACAWSPVAVTQRDVGQPAGRLARAAPGRARRRPAGRAPSCGSIHGRGDAPRPASGA